MTDQEEAAQFVVKINELQIDEMGQPVIANNIGALDVDIILDEAPDSVTTMQDTFELLQSLAAAGVPMPPTVVIEMSGLPASTKQRIHGHAGAGAAARSDAGAGEADRAGGGEQQGRHEQGLRPRQGGERSEQVGRHLA